MADGVNELNDTFDAELTANRSVAEVNRANTTEADNKDLNLLMLMDVLGHGLLSPKSKE
jgi:hypothetical protein